MVSLYVCDFPQSVEKDELSSIFDKFEGYIETRTARDRAGQKIAFVDYTDREKAQNAL
jgi:RNA recognition motif-containing protein